MALSAMRASLEGGLDAATLEQLAMEWHDGDDIRQLATAMRIGNGSEPSDHLDAALLGQVITSRESGRSLACRGEYAKAESMYEKCLALLESMHCTDLCEHNCILAMQAALLSIDEYTNLDNRALLESLYADARTLKSKYLPEIAQLLFAVRIKDGDLDAACEAMGDVHALAANLVSQGVLPKYDMRAASKTDEEFMWSLYQQRLPTPA